jgi:hypothetical protein
VRIVSRLSDDVPGGLLVFGGDVSDATSFSFSKAWKLKLFLSSEPKLLIN